MSASKDSQLNVDRHPLLIELGCEELPARLIESQVKQLAKGIGDRLADAGMIDAGTNDASQPDIYATPRRLAVCFKDVLERQADRELERKGPAAKVALDAEGQPTKAAQGFARSVGKRFEDLDWLENEKGRWLYCKVQEAGSSLNEILGPILEATVRDMAGARSMRWSNQSDRFLRPIRWLTVLHGGAVVPIRLAGLIAGRITQGHRIHATGPHEITNASDYEQVLENACVLVNMDRRRKRISEQIQALVVDDNLSVDDNPALLSENVGLTEWPLAVMGSFDPEFLDVPEEALVSSMQQHQKCFPVRTDNGRLAARFIAIANIESIDKATMTAGFERVIRPRLADAQFFWNQDRKRSLEDRRPRLDNILFQEKLGSVGDKVRRLERIGAQLAASLNADPAQVQRAAQLCKCDLVTEMVGEFPELQGIMGRYFGLNDGEPKTVASAIEAHYMPRQAGAELPQDPEGQALAVADRLDSIVGLFAAGKQPKGSKDPFALRRAALGVIRILEASKTSLMLDKIVAVAADALADQRTANQLQVGEDVQHSVVQFLNDRLRSHANDCGISTATVQAVAAGKTSSVIDFMDRARAVQAFSDRPEAESLVAAYKRASNLLKQAEEDLSPDVLADVDVKYLHDEEEKKLFDDIESCESALREAVDRADYPAALTKLAGLRESLDAFFDQVMVMVDDNALRRNRLALLVQLRGLIGDIADLARLGRSR